MSTMAAETGLPVLASQTKTAVKAYVRQLAKMPEADLLGLIETLAGGIDEYKQAIGLALHVASDRLLPAEYSAVLATVVERTGEHVSTVRRWRAAVQEKYGLVKPAAQTSLDHSAARALRSERTPVRDEGTEGEVASTSSVIDTTVVEPTANGKSPDRIRAAVFLIPVFGAEAIAAECQLGDVRAAHDVLGQALALMEATTEAEPIPDVAAKAQAINRRMKARQGSRKAG